MVFKYKIDRIFLQFVYRMSSRFSWVKSDSPLRTTHTHKKILIKMFHLFLQIKWTKKIEFKYFICFIYLRKNEKKCRGWHAGRFWDFTSANCRQVADDFCPTRELTQSLHFFPFFRKLFFIHPSYFTLEILQVHSDKVHNERFWRFSRRSKYVLGYSTTIIICPMSLMHFYTPSTALHTLS